MKKNIFCLFVLFSQHSQAAIFFPEVQCQIKSRTASCFIKNESLKTMKCEFLVVAESENGKFISALSDALVPPLEKDILEVVFGQEKDQAPIKFASGEANCTYL